MSKIKSSTDIGQVCFKVRIVIPGAVLHVLSASEPRVRTGPGPSILGVDWDVITDTEHGDAVGFIRWADVSAVTWRRA
jgi:hypothetical protein